MLASTNITHLCLSSQLVVELRMKTFHLILPCVLSSKSIDVFDYNSLKWKRLARMVMRRDGYMCQLSKRYGKAVPAEVVHHIFPVDEYPEYAYEPWNLIALSRKMHNTLHDRNTDALTAEGVALMRRVSRDRDNKGR